ncbi:AP-2 complex subunit mu [Etheostoma spectabile]|uniref:AP-2 complex subunit mu n=1 Tax=Etheostoma spectabile TaxID=54343 RepID=UPI0013AF9F68|nr:AP-2 complex subunit mu-like [Etheostoma spectabile]XP_032364976.1 AP-2 complex subunit mu-like [Etheostoma spectabile]
MIGGLFIYNPKGEVLISRVYRHDIGKWHVAHVKKSNCWPAPPTRDHRPPWGSRSSTGRGDVSEDNVNNNFLLIYELLDGADEELPECNFWMNNGSSSTFRA